MSKTATIAKIRPDAAATQATATSEIPMTTRTADYDAIVRVMRLYIDAFNENDVAKLKQAFDDDAWIFYIAADGSLHEHRISERL